MTYHNTKQIMLAVLAAGVLALGAAAVPAMAQDDARDHCEEDPESERCERQRAAEERQKQAEERRKQAEERRAAAAADGENRTRADDARAQAEDRRAEAREHQLRAQHLRGRVHAYCEDHPEERRCQAIQAAHSPCARAQRADHALVRSLDALERRDARLAGMLADVQERLEGNLSANETAALQERHDRIESLLERMQARLQGMQERHDALRERWEDQCVRLRGPYAEADDAGGDADASDEAGDASDADDAGDASDSEGSDESGEGSDEESDEESGEE